MKIIKYFSYAAAIAIMAIGTAACTQDEDAAPTPTGQDINATFSVGGVQTRVNTLGTGDSWEDNDEIKVRVSCNGYTPTTAILSFNGEMNKWTRNSSFRWLSQGKDHAIVAVHPSTYSFESYELPTDQSSLEKLKTADLINGGWYGEQKSQVDIPMKHRMSLVTVTYEVGTADYPDMDICDLMVCSKNLDVSFIISKDRLVMIKPTTTTTYWVTAYKHDTNQFSAIVVPGTYAAGDAFLKLTSDNSKNFKVNMKSSTEFKEGYRYDYTVKVGKNKVELTQTNVEALSGWTKEDDLN